MTLAVAALRVSPCTRTDGGALPCTDYFPMFTFSILLPMMFRTTPAGSKRIVRYLRRGHALLLAVAEVSRSSLT